ncbi:UNVERIFIED_CONTAM: hypothetical protein HDU68_006901 [Siphonaria sp. JEL0065]|nr:hypothetical protein HDU68_006901 [Siphonaria sp. JEL0065]
MAVPVSVIPTFSSLSVAPSVVPSQSPGQSSLPLQSRTSASVAIAAVTANLSTGANVTSSNLVVSAATSAVSITSPAMTLTPLATSATSTAPAMTLPPIPTTGMQQAEGTISSTNVAIIAGIGGGVAFFALTLALFVCRRKSNKQKKEELLAVLVSGGGASRDDSALGQSRTDSPSDFLISNGVGKNTQKQSSGERSPFTSPSTSPLPSGMAVAPVIPEIGITPAEDGSAAELGSNNSSTLNNSTMDNNNSALNNSAFNNGSLNNNNTLSKRHSMLQQDILYPSTLDIDKDMERAWSIGRNVNTAHFAVVHDVDERRLSIASQTSSRAAASSNGNVNGFAKSFYLRYASAGSDAGSGVKSLSSEPSESEDFEFPERMLSATRTRSGTNLNQMMPSSLGYASYSSPFASPMYTSSPTYASPLAAVQEDFTEQWNQFFEANPGALTFSEEWQPFYDSYPGAREYAQFYKMQKEGK